MTPKTLMRAIFAAMVTGAAVGVWLPGLSPWVGWLGTVFKLSLSMVVMPLVLTSIIDGIGSLGDVRKLGRMGGTTLGYYAVTTGFAVVIGLSLVSAIQPGVRAAPGPAATALEKITPHDGPRGLARAATVHLDTSVRPKLAQSLQASLEDAAAQGASFESLRARATRFAGSAALRSRLSDAPTKPPTSAGTFLGMQLKKALQNPFSALANGNVLAVIVFALLLGAALSTLGERGRAVLELNRTLNQATGKIVGWIMQLAPLGVFGLIVDVVSATGARVFADLGWYALTVAAGLALHALFVLPALNWAVAGVSPLRFFAAVRPALAVAFSTSSSNATLPVTVESVQENLDVDPKTAGFVLPLGATVNMDGTALYEAVAAVFIAQLYGVALDVPSQAVIAITACLAAIGAAGIPAAGTVTMTMVLAAAGLPLEAVGLILAVDRPLDMARTAVNVCGDASGAVVVDALTHGRRDAA